MSNERLRVGIIQSNPHLLDIEKSCRDLTPQLAALANDGAQLVVMPELASSGYCFKNKDQLDSVSETNDGKGPFLSWIKAKAAEHDFAIVTGYPEKAANAEVFNSAALIDRHGVIGNYRKLHLFNHEKELFTPGDLGVPVFDYAGVKIAILICFDWAFPEVWRSAALAGAEIIAHPANLVLPWAQTACQGHALCNRTFIATANRVGCEKSWRDNQQITFTGGSQLLNTEAQQLISGPTDACWQQLAEINLTAARDKSIKQYNDLFSDRRPDCY